MEHEFFVIIAPHGLTIATVMALTTVKVTSFYDPSLT
jgi:aromatic ring-opening dioxygenase LigB subunit